MNDIFKPNVTAIADVLLSMRSFAKWWMECVRNFIVVAALGLLAERTHSTPLMILYMVSFLTFWMYLASYPMIGFSNLFYPMIASRKVYLLVSSVSSIAMATAGYFASGYLIRLLEQIIKVQVPT